MRGLVISFDPQGDALTLRGERLLLGRLRDGRLEGPEPVTVRDSLLWYVRRHLAGARGSEVSGWQTGDRWWRWLELVDRALEPAGRRDHEPA